MKIKRYKMKPGWRADMIVGSSKCAWHYGGIYTNSSAYFHLIKFFYKKDIDFNFTIEIEFKENTEDWDDLKNILVAVKAKWGLLKYGEIDDDFCQPYTPFYSHFDKDVVNFPALEFVIEQYNKLLDSFPFLEEVKE